MEHITVASPCVQSEQNDRAVRKSMSSSSHDRERCCRVIQTPALFAARDGYFFFSLSLSLVSSARALKLPTTEGTNTGRSMQLSLQLTQTVAAF